MRRINVKNIYKKIRQHYFALFLIVTFVFCFLSLLVFYKYYYLVEKEIALPQGGKVYFKEKEYENIKKELREREKIYSDIDKEIIENPFIGLTE